MVVLLWVLLLFFLCLLAVIAVVMVVSPAARIVTFDIFSYWFVVLDLTQFGVFDTQNTREREWERLGYQPRPEYTVHVSRCLLTNRG